MYTGHCSRTEDNFSPHALLTWPRTPSASAVSPTPTRIGPGGLSSSSERRRPSSRRLSSTPFRAFAHTTPWYPRMNFVETTLHRHSTSWSDSYSIRTFRQLCWFCSPHSYTQDILLDGQIDRPKEQKEDEGRGQPHGYVLGDKHSSFGDRAALPLRGLQSPDFPSLGTHTVSFISTMLLASITQMFK